VRGEAASGRRCRVRALFVPMIGNNATLRHTGRCQQWQQSVQDFLLLLSIISVSRAIQRAKFGWGAVVKNNRQRGSDVPVALDGELNTQKCLKTMIVNIHLLHLHGAAHAEAAVTFSREMFFYSFMKSDLMLF
jgi:hypothetical protein